MRTLVLIAIFFPVLLSAQRYNDWWIIYPGTQYSSGLHFSNYNFYPDTIGGLLTGAGFDNILGKTSISDFSGNLLFYTDGIRIFNRNHQIMSNGNFIFFNYNTTYASTMGATIVPYPCHPNQYFVFTPGRITCPYSLSVVIPDTMMYSIVDMSLDNGLGAVVGGQKAIPLHIGVTDAVNAVRNAAGDGYWVVTHDYQGANFLAYEVTCSGLNPVPVVSPSNILLTVDTTFLANGNFLFDCDNKRVNLKFNPQGDQLTLTHWVHFGNFVQQNYTVSIAGFDNSTGVVSIPQDLNLNGSGPGVEYSPSGQYLYAIESYALNPYIAEVVQFDLWAGSLTDIINSKVVVSPPIPNPSLYSMGIL